MISSYNNKFMFILKLTADDNKNKKRAYVKLGHYCTVRVVWCHWLYDLTQLNWTILAKY